MNQISPTVRIIGAGRAGGAFDLALRRAGWQVELISHARITAETSATDGAIPALEDVDGVDLVLLCVPDRVVADVARSITVSDSVVVAHCSGSLGLDVLAPAPRRASIHPLVPLADPTTGSALLRGAYFAVSGDPIGHELVASLDGHPVVVAESDRVLHHSACVIASNHLVALMAQVESVADKIGVPLDAYLQLARLALDNVSEFGPSAALTGPVARGDWGTVERHLEALPAREREAYLALARRAAALAGREFPDIGLELPEI
ncbi:MAG: Rossmann-like and DUF2520 domain-containing protein [Microthrixaceae bacterium]